MGGLDPVRLREYIDEYERREPFARVEDDRLATLPAAFAEGTYLWKDIEWIVRWYCRRPLDGRGAAEEAAFRENDMAAIRDAIESTLAADTIPERIHSLSRLAGVDVPIATAMLQFMDPLRFAVITERSWNALYDMGLVDELFHTPVDAPRYVRYLRECTDLATEADVTVAAVERALWRIGADTAQL